MNIVPASVFQRVEQIMSRTRQTASPTTTEESNSSATGNVSFFTHLIAYSLHLVNSITVVHELL